jgi:glucose-6-phosphate isomerase
VIEALHSSKQTKIWFFDNLDNSEYLEFAQGNPSFKSVGFLLISKSGNTLETVVQAERIIGDLQSQGLKLSEHLFVITENKNSSLQKFAQAHQLKQAPVPLNVGGRFSVLTCVGLVPIGLMGIDLKQLRFGALAASKSLDLVAEMSAQMTDSFYRGEAVTYFWFYSSKLRQLGMWLQQLWAESLGKKTDRAGNIPVQASLPMVCIGASDQHSVLQQNLETKIKHWDLFFTVEKSDSDQIIKQCQFEGFDYLNGRSMHDVLNTQARANQMVMNDLGIKTGHLSINKLSAESLGFLLVYWQLVIATLGENLNINAFDQPSVELGKRLAKDLLSK